MKKLTFETDCVHSTYEDISVMTELATDIKYEAFLRHVSFADLCRLFPFYGTHSKQGLLMLCNDWSVSYHKSIYKGRKCYYLCHSMIEYIFI